MSYSEVPTRTSADTNSSADINQLQTNITDGRARMALWSAAVTYTINEGTVYGGLIYISLQNGNTNKQPDSEPTWWQQYPFSRLSVHDPNITYAQWDHVSAGGYIWTSLQNANTGNTPAEGSAWWGLYPVINEYTEKTTLANDDLFLIEDSADGNKKKRVKKSNITATAATAKALEADAGTDIPIKMGDDIAGNKTSFTNASSSEVASVDSLGNITGNSLADTLILSTGNQTVRLGDAAGATKLKIEDSTTAEVAQIDSLGNISSTSLKDTPIEATDSQDIKLGDAAGAEKLSIKDSTNAEVASVNSDGDITGNDISGARLLTTDIDAGTGNNQNVKLGDNLGGNTLSIQDSDDNEIASVDSNGNIQANSLLGTKIDAGGGNNQIVKLGDNAGVNDLSIQDSDDLEVAAIDSDGNISGNSVFNTPLDAGTGNDQTVKLGDAAGSNKLTITDSTDVEQMSIDSDGTATINTITNKTGAGLDIDLKSASALKVEDSSANNLLNISESTGLVDVRTGNFLVYEDILGMLPGYSVDKTYDINDFTTSGGIIYKSLQNSNTGNTPSSSPTYWEELSLDDTIKVPEWDSSTTYGANDIINYNGWLYISLQASNTNHTPVITADSWWAPYPRIDSLTQVADDSEIDSFIVASGGGDGLKKAPLSDVIAPAISKKVPLWDSGETYDDNDIINYLGNLYSSLQGSNTNQNPATATTYWKKLPDINGETELTLTIDEDDVFLVDDADDSYKKKKIKLETLVAHSRAVLGEYESSFTYSQDDFTADGGVIYKSLQNSNTGNAPASSPTYWEPLSVDDEKIPEWDSGVTYGANDILAYNGWLYVSLQASNLNHTPAITADSWWAPYPRIDSLTQVADDTEIDSFIVTSGGGDGLKKAPLSDVIAPAISKKVPLWDSAETYNDNDIINYQGNLYSSLQGSNTNQNPTTALTYWKELPDISSKTELTSIDEDDVFMVDDADDTNKKKKIKLETLVTHSRAVLGYYVSSWEYDTDDLIAYNGVIYKSLQSENTGNTPSSSPTYWEEYPTGGDNTTQVNYAINPINLVVQRHLGELTSATSIANNVYASDRHKVVSSNSNQTAQIITASQPSGLAFSKSLKINNTAAGSKIMGWQSNQEYLRGDGLVSGSWTWSAYVKSNSSNARLTLYDGSTYSYSSAHTGGGSWELLTVTKSFSSPSSVVYEALICSASRGTVSLSSGDYIETTGDNFIPGSERIEISPRAELAELWECMRFCWMYKYTTARRAWPHDGRTESTGEFILNLYMQWPRQLPGTPTVTAGNAGTWLLENQKGVTNTTTTTGGYPAFNQRSNVGMEFSLRASGGSGTFTFGDRINFRLMNSTSYILVDADV